MLVMVIWLFYLLISLSLFLDYREEGGGGVGERGGGGGGGEGQR